MHEYSCKRVYIMVKGRKEWYLYSTQSFAGIPHIRNAAMRIFSAEFMSFASQGRNTLGAFFLVQCDHAMRRFLHASNPFLLNNLIYVLAMTCWKSNKVYLNYLFLNAAVDYIRR